MVYSATFVTCLLPPHPPADVLMALTLNGQDYVHQRVEEWYDIFNKSETGPEHDELRQRMEAKEWPLPGNLSRLTTAVLTRKVVIAGGVRNAARRRVAWDSPTKAAK